VASKDHEIPLVDLNTLIPTANQKDPFHATDAIKLGVPEMEAAVHVIPSNEYAIPFPPTATHSWLFHAIQFTVDNVEFTVVAHEFVEE
jgi:hypothetical protein